MGWQLWQQKAEKILSSATPIEPFHIFTITLLSLLLPLSFLLLARLSCVHYLSTLASFPTKWTSSLLVSFFLNTNPALLYVLVSTISIATLVHGLTGKITLLSESTGSVYRPCLYTAWIFLCTLQVFVFLGIEGSIAAGVDGYGFDVERSLSSRVIFFLGLHETMLHWSRAVVKPVVDDTVSGVARQETWVQRVAMALSFGTLWWWKLRDEVESLVIVAEAKKDMLMGVGAADFFGWWLYYLTVTIGMVKIVKLFMWLWMIFLCRRVRGNYGASSEVEDKV